MMPDFLSIEYLSCGSPRQQYAFTLLNAHNVMQLLKPFDPIVTGTIPLGIDIATSDLDIICHHADATQFSHVLAQSFSSYPLFRVSNRQISGRPTIICQFQLENLPIEIFGQNRPSVSQEAFIHLVNEYKILEARGSEFRNEVIRLKLSGMKTEPAFAFLLGLKGDPYEVMLHASG